MEITYLKLTETPLPNANLYVLSGAEEQPKKAVLDQIRKYASGGEESFDEEIYDGKSVPVKQILESAFVIPFLSPKRLVMIRDANRMSQDQAEQIVNGLGFAVETKSKKGKKKDSEPAELRQLPDTSCVVFVCSEYNSDDSDVQRKAKTITALFENAAKSLGVLITFPELKGFDALKQLKLNAEKDGKILKPEAAKKLLEIVDGSYSLASTELIKTILYVGANKEITENDIMQTAIPSRNARIFTMVDAIAEGKLGPALTQLHVMLSGSERAEVVAMRSIMPLLARQFRLLWQARAIVEAGFPLSKAGTVPDEIKKSLPSEPSLISLLIRQPYLESKYKIQAGRFDFVKLSKAFCLLYETDLALKGMSPSLSATDTLERLTANLCRLTSR